MRYVFLSIFCFIAKGILSLRYKISVKGKKEVFKNFKKNKGFIILPNHPALVDPIIIAILLWPKFQMRPLVVEYVYRQSGINIIMRLMKAVCVPNLDTSLNEVKIKKAQQVIEEVIKGLNKKENYILYPSGRLKHTGKEIVGGASATQKILQECKDINIVLVRTTGLWGSSFSRAYTGRSPDFKKMVIKNIKNLFRCFVFFMPRRKVLIEMEAMKEDFPRNGNRLEVNKYLEKWYNNYLVDNKRVDTEPLNLVSYSVFKKKYCDMKTTPKAMKKKKREYTSDVEEKVFSELSRLQPDIDIKENMHLSMDLGLDSLDIAEVITFLSVHFEIGDIHPEDIETVRDVLDIASGEKKQKEIKQVFKWHWPEEKTRKNLVYPKASSLIEAILKTCDRMKNAPAIADDMLGVLSYKKLKLVALVLSQEIKKMEGKHIGILLPASVGAYISIIAVMLANKIPVMLNWTAGPRYLNHMASITKTKNIISSWKFLEKVSNVEFGDITEKLQLLEDIKKRVSIKSKLQAFRLSLKKTKSLLKNLNLSSLKKEDIAVILFTSGTEANPKGVPLSHGNILENQEAALGCIKINSKDIMYGILPPFHSFGFSVVGFFPIIIGMKVAFGPDPTDSHAVAEGIKRWKTTIICAAPSFLRGILNASTKEQLKTIRLFVTGAEKTSQEIFDKIKKLNKNIIEGYGITECSPIISLVREKDIPKGVGKLLSNVEFCTVNLETKKPLESNTQEGEMCVRGPSIFSGYLEKKKSPFVTINDKKWYCTGDLGYLDEEGNIILSGRLKRFAKIGGEMISLGSVEDIILQSLHLRNMDLEGSVPIAVLAVEKEKEKSELILVTTIDLNKTDVNMILKKAGCSRLIKIGKIKKIDKLPIMGTGKIDYRFLQKMVE